MHQTHPVLVTWVGHYSSVSCEVTEPPSTPDSMHSQSKCSGASTGGVVTAGPAVQCDWPSSSPDVWSDDRWRPPAHALGPTRHEAVDKEEENKNIRIVFIKNKVKESRGCFGLKLSSRCSFLFSTFSSSSLASLLSDTDL